MNIVIDLETTGKYHTMNEIIQIGAILFDNDLEPADTFMTYIKPLKPKLFTKEAQDINGITLDFLADKPMPAVARIAFTTWLEDASEGQQLTPLGHNYDCFDANFLKTFLGLDKYERLLSHRSRDTMKVMYYLQDKGTLPKLGGGLQAALDHFRIKRKEPHDALSDCYATLKLYKTLVNL